MAAVIERVDCDVRTFPTPEPEADGTFEWSETTAVVVQLASSGSVGVGWTYSSPARGSAGEAHLASVVTGRPALDVAAGWAAMHRAGRNVGTRGLWLEAVGGGGIGWGGLQARAV